MINNFVNLKLALKIYISNALKWKEEDVLVVEEEEKVGEAYHMFIKIEFILDKNLKQVKELFQNF